ncbi:hypothetical protein MMC07_005581 [Pseudocyphellaria aurata]|nr:hypothetical protein [Pseudocyphellaria aurata]
MLCDLCKPITVAALRDNDFEHQPNLASLKASAEETNCSFCNLLWQCLVKSVQPQYIAAHLQGQKNKNENLTDFVIRLNGEILDTGQKSLNELEPSKIWVYSGTRAEFGNSGTQVYAYLELYAPRGEPAGRYLNGREVVSNPAGESCFGLIKRWLHHCEVNHGCQAKEPPLLPTRVLDVKPKHPVLRVSQGRRDHYVALSYCWGGPQKIVTTEKTFEQFTKNIDNGLSETLKNAIEITRNLNLQYLWIDALCIIQGGEDFNIESLKMSQYYGNAYFTISAGCAASSQDGFLASRPLPSATPCKLDYNRPPFREVDVLFPTPLGSVFVCLPPSKAIGPLETRAWTFQEKILSRRELLYGHEQISFRCLERQIFENGTSSIRQQIVPYPDVGGLDQKPLAEQKAVLLRRWYKMLESYTRREMTNPADKLTALAGIAQVIHQTLQCKYLFGLWEDDIIRGILWTTNVLRYSKDWAEALRRPLADRAPSWSWASVEGHVSHYQRIESLYLDPKYHRIIILGHDFQQNSFDPIRSVKPIARELRVRGVLKSVQRTARSVLQYRDQSPEPWWRFKHPRMFLLEPVQSIPPKETCSNSPQVVVGLGLLDVPDEPLPDLFCMRVIADYGLILVSNAKGGYKRVGTFNVEDKTWFDHGDPEDIILT